MIEVRQTIYFQLLHNSKLPSLSICTFLSPPQRGSWFFLISFRDKSKARGVWRAGEFSLDDGTAWVAQGVVRLHRGSTAAGPSAGYHERETFVMLAVLRTYAGQEKRSGPASAAAISEYQHLCNEAFTVCQEPCCRRQ